ncbi:MAG: hypothetical protein KAX49_15755 [Halanaerobiales bacterium]|nr:hypothetical protein [Halanaerobiales bacterium]
MSKELKDVISSLSDITIGKESYKVKAITLGDISDFQKWCDTKKKQEVIDIYNLAGQVPDVKEIMSITGDDNYYDTMMNTLDGVLYLLHKVINRNNETDISIEQLSNDLDIENFEYVVGVLFGNAAEKVEPKKHKKKRKSVLN